MPRVKSPYQPNPAGVIRAFEDGVWNWGYKWAKTDGQTLWLYEHAIACWIPPIVASQLTRQVEWTLIEQDRLLGYMRAERNRARNGTPNERVSRDPRQRTLYVSNGGEWGVTMHGDAWRRGYNMNLTFQYLAELGVHATAEYVLRWVGGRATHARDEQQRRHAAAYLRPDETTWRASGNKLLPDWAHIRCPTGTFADYTWSHRPEQVLAENALPDGTMRPWDGSWVPVMRVWTEHWDGTTKPVAYAVAPRGGREYAEDVVRRREIKNRARDAQLNLEGLRR